MQLPCRSLLALLALLLSAFGGQRLLAASQAVSSDDGEAYLVASDEVATTQLSPNPVGPGCGDLPGQHLLPLTAWSVSLSSHPVVALLYAPDRSLLRGSAGGPRAP